MEKIRTNQKTERTSGITLIALVITIIVLLILAAISISTLTGENGLLTKANEASSKTTESGAMEKIKVSVGESYDERGKFDSEEFKRRIVEKGGSIITESAKDIVVEMDGYQATVDKQTGEIKDIVTAEEGLKPIEKVTDENPGELAGGGTEDNPYLIQSIEDLVGLSNSVSPIGDEPEEGKEYDNYEGKYFKLETTLDFASRDSYVNPDRTDFEDANGDGITGTLIEEMTTGAGFRPIGKYRYDSTLRQEKIYPFNGNIDGNNKELRNMYINGGNYKGLIGVSEGENIKISKLNMINVDFSECSYQIGGIIGYCKSKNITVEDCKVTGNIKGGSNVGGIIGQIYAYPNNVSLSLQNNLVYATIAANSQSVAGLIGQGENIIMLNVVGCKVSGSISASGYKGGLFGYFMVKGDATIDNCTNSSDIIGTGSSAYTGGFIGYFGTDCDNFNIKNSYNYGNFSGCSSSTGGFLGYVSYSKNINIENCTNFGNIITEKGGYGLAGILGRNGGKANIKNCSNFGNIDTKGLSNHIAGILGQTGGEEHIKNCYNKGNICGSSATGGIVGNISGTISKCYNEGQIDGGNYSGGIAGDISSSVLIDNCYNLGTVTGKYCVGGISGYSGTISNCYNNGDIIVNRNNDESVENIGGITGSKGGKIENTYNLGAINVSAGRITNVGSVIGYVGSISDVINNAYLASTYEKGMGGDNEDTDTITKAIENIEDLYTLINENLTEADGWTLKEGEKLPTLNLETE